MSQSKGGGPSANAGELFAVNRITRAALPTVKSKFDPLRVVLHA